MVNETVQLASVNSSIDILQFGIADLERRMDSAELAESNEDIAALRLELSKMKAALGESRNQEAFWRQQISDSKEARKSQGDLGKG